MIDNLKDLIAHTYDLGLNLIKVTGTDTETKVFSVADDQSLVMNAKFKQPIKDFIGTFGMPNMSILKTILNLDVYDKNTDISILTHEEKGPVSMMFKNGSGDFENTYRFMVGSQVTQLLEEKPLKVQFEWDVELIPTIEAIQKLKFQSQANPDRQTFKAEIKDGKLKFFFGDHSTHAGNFVFANNITGTMTENHFWPVNHVIKILSLSGDKVMKINGRYAMEITVDSGIAKYTYLIPAHRK